MNIIIPMAGQGSRFVSSGFQVPKPLIDVAGKCMYRHATDSLPLNLASRLIFILIRNSYLENLIADIKLNYSKYPLSIIILEDKTAGQAETILRSENSLDLTVPTLIHNCDTYFLIDQIWGKLLLSEDDGAMLLFSSTENRWSYAKLDENSSKIIDVREKEVISEHASTGTYYFKDTSYMLENIKFIIENNIRENNEFYLSSVYRVMLQHQKKILPLWTKRFLCFGTPQDLVYSLNELIKSPNILFGF